MNCIVKDIIEMVGLERIKFGKDWIGLERFGLERNEL